MSTDPKAYDSEPLHLFYRNPEKNSYAAPSRPTAVLGVHVAHKGFQAGSCLGFGIGTLVMLVRGRRGLKLLRGLTKVVAGTSTFGSAIGVSMAANKIQSLPKSEQQDGIEDRAFRIFHNRKQNRVDRFSCIGMGAGVVGGCLLLGLTPSAVVGGAGLGSVGAIVAHVAIPFEDE
uniref:Uncharacterized protein n=1 Tax=Lotharella globosa TaxID=91324 RepID=A0A6V3R9E5_9EUKA|mmetsp:Transcript_22609/g.44039  ORF Transcript_22609/g.44039 Transcript_22609/m.44039 type:complete len:174 (+) Transcript_22609:61-582(+)